MVYQRPLLRWSHRDYLAVLVIAVTVAFLIGTALVFVAAGTQTSTIASEIESPGSAVYHDSLATARASVGADSSAIVLPIAEVTLPNETTRYVVGIPEATADSYESQNRVLASDNNGTTLGDIREPMEQQLQGQHRTITVEVFPRNPDSSVISPEWYITDPGTVERLGPTGAFTVQPTNPDTNGVPLRSALLFFLRGTQQALTTLTVAAICGGLLVAVTIYSVTRMSVRDRLSTIRIIRSTGGTPERVFGLYILRAAILTTVGIVLGYAVGVILTNTAVTLAVTVGLPTSLAVEVTPGVVQVLVPISLGLLVTGALSGAVAVWPTIRQSPAQLTDQTAGTRSPTSVSNRQSHIPTIATPTLLDWRALIPTAATLTAFVVFVVLISSMAGVVSPLMTTDGATISESGSNHPFASKVPETYADALQSREIDASPEILLLEVRNGQPFLARGVRYESFANVTNVALERGRPPQAADEAVIGVDLVQTLNVDVGDKILLGGSTDTALAQVTVVGTFEAPGLTDDQLLVSLPTARHLSGTSSNMVNFVRADRLPERPGNTDTAIEVVNVSIPAPVAANTSLPVAFTARNVDSTERTATITVRYRNRSQQVQFTLEPNEQQTKTVQFAAGQPGEYTLRVGDTNRTIRVVDPDTLIIQRLPSRAPVQSEPAIQVVNVSGTLMSNATISVENRSISTGSDGSARIPLTDPGEYTIIAKQGVHTASKNVLVSANATREPNAQLTVTPSSPSLLTRPEIRLKLYNPWSETLGQTITVEAPGGPYERDVKLDPGQQSSVAIQLPRRPPGSYDVQVSAVEQTLATTTYKVTGDDRIVSALASSGRTGGTSISRAIDAAFGNLQLVFAVLLGLAGLMTVGGTTATFAQAVHARRRTIGIHRATGAVPRQVLYTVLSDALIIGTAATAVALIIAFFVLYALSVAGYLTLFGVRLSVIPTSNILIGAVVGALVLTLLGATLSTIVLLARSPVVLLSGEQPTEQ